MIYLYMNPLAHAAKPVATSESCTCTLGFAVERDVTPHNVYFLGTTYTLVKLPDDASSVTSTFTCTLKFLVKDCDPNTGEADEEGYEDEYMVRT